jgi:uncharacterized membrane protein YhhN
MAPEALVIVLTCLVAASAICCITASYLDRQWLFWITKPLTMVFVLAVALALRPTADTSGAYQALVIAGLLLSLAGDVFLMLPSDRFVEGLSSFFVGHVCYVCAFVLDAGGGTAALLREPAVLLLLTIACAGMYRYLWPGLGGMKIPVAVYILAIAAMAWQATGRWSDTAQLGALLGCIGAFLFVLSDSALAVNRFRRPFVASQAVVLGTYFPAQLLIALSLGGASI